MGRGHSKISRSGVATKAAFIFFLKRIGPEHVSPALHQKVAENINTAVAYFNYSTVLERYDTMTRPLRGRSETFPHSRTHCRKRTKGIRVDHHVELWNKITTASFPTIPGHVPPSKRPSPASGLARTRRIEAFLERAFFASRYIAVPCLPTTVMHHNRSELLFTGFLAYDCEAYASGYAGPLS